MSKSELIYNKKTGEYDRVFIEEKKGIDIYEIIEYILWIITSILFITFYSGITEYKIFIWFVVLSSLYSIFSSKFIMNLFNKNFEYNKNNDKIKNKK